MSHEHYDITQVLSSAAIEAGSTTAQPCSLFHTVTTHHHSSKTVKAPQYTSGLHHRGPAREDTKTLSLSVPGIGAVESSTESKAFQERFHDSVAQVKNFRWKRAASAALTPRLLGLLLWPEQSGREATSSKTA